MLDTIDPWARSFHFFFMNHLKGLKMNILAFLYVELDKAVEDYQKSNGSKVNYMGLILMVFKFITE